MAITVTARRRRKGGGLDALIRAVEAPTPAMEAVGRVMDEHVAERFASQTDPWGQPWLPPTLRTVELQLERGGGKQGQGIASRRYVRVFENGRHLVVGIASAIARYRHYGAPRNRMFGKAPAPIPPRPELPLRGDRVDLPDDLRAELMDAFRQALRQAVRDAGA